MRRAQNPSQWPRVTTIISRARSPIRVRHHGLHLAFLVRATPLEDFLVARAAFLPDRTLLSAQVDDGVIRPSTPNPARFSCATSCGLALPARRSSTPLASLLPARLRFEAGARSRIETPREGVAQAWDCASSPHLKRRAALRFAAYKAMRSRRTSQALCSSSRGARGWPRAI